MRCRITHVVIAGIGLIVYPTLYHSKLEPFTILIDEIFTIIKYIRFHFLSPYLEVSLI